MYGIFSSYLGRLAPNYHFSSTRYAPTIPIESSALTRHIFLKKLVRAMFFVAYRAARSAVRKF
jgi:hypothetical protein